jgi:hypothetical protein
MALSTNWFNAAAGDACFRSDVACDCRKNRRVHAFQALAITVAGVATAVYLRREIDHYSPSGDMEEARRHRKAVSPYMLLTVISAMSWTALRRCLNTTRSHDSLRA